MNTYDYRSLIDGTNFGLICDYLFTPSSSIQFLLHVREREQLAKLATLLDAENVDTHLDPSSRTEAMKIMFQDGSLKMSSQFAEQLRDPSWWINPLKVDRHAQCFVIYFPPYYLVHTPGLFEWLDYEQQAQQEREAELRDNPAKLQNGKEIDKDGGHEF